MKIWLDDIRSAPGPYPEWCWCRSVCDAKSAIMYSERYCSVRSGAEEMRIELLDLDHDLGDYACEGGDAIKLLDWLEETGRNYPIHLHTMNPVGRDNMRAIINHNGWKEIM